jgi:hypothetical protein
LPVAILLDPRLEAASAQAAFRVSAVRYSPPLGTPARGASPYIGARYLGFPHYEEPLVGIAEPVWLMQFREFAPSPLRKRASDQSSQTGPVAPSQPTIAVSTLSPASVTDSKEMSPLTGKYTVSTVAPCSSSIARFASVMAEVAMQIIQNREELNWSAIYWQGQLG